MEMINNFHHIDPTYPNPNPKLRQMSTKINIYVYVNFIVEYVVIFSFHCNNKHFISLIVKNENYDENIITIIINIIDKMLVKYASKSKV
jgi:hypothetical protein